MLEFTPYANRCKKRAKLMLVEAVIGYNDLMVTFLFVRVIVRFFSCMRKEEPHMSLKEQIELSKNDTIYSSRK